MASILHTIAEMGARLDELRQQLSQLESQSQSQSHPRQRVPYAYSRGSVPLTAFPSVPLSSPPFHSRPSQEYRPRQSQRPPRQDPSQSQSQSQGQGLGQESKPYPTVPLSAVLVPQEEVVFRVILRKDENGQPVHASFRAVFDGAQLTIIQNDLVGVMVGQQSVKPGELLYRFIDGLKVGGHLKRTFTVAPWKLCSVVREGVEVTLEELRRRVLAQ